MSNEELVDKRLENIEKKIDKIMDIVSKTQLQEHRISELEKDNDRLNQVTLPELAQRITLLEHRAGNTALKIVCWIAAGVGTILLSFIAVKVGLK